MPTPTINVSAVIFRNRTGQVLTVRKAGTELFQFPGGKPEPGENARQAAVREVAEELGVELAGAALKELGTFDAPAANEAGYAVSATVFSYPYEVSAQASHEIAELAWVNPHAPDKPLAPLLAEEVFPALAARTAPRSLAVYTGASTGTDPHNLELARELGTALGAHGVHLIYGGGKVGLMGAVADAAHAAGAPITGVIPQHLVDGEIAHPGLDRLEMVETMHERKQRMSDLADACVALPGGAGTLDEFFDVWTRQQLGLHATPLALFGATFWAPLVDLLDHLVEQGLVRAADRDSLIVADTAEELFAQLDRWVAPRPKWS